MKYLPLARGKLIILQPFTGNWEYVDALSLAACLTLSGLSLLVLNLRL